MPLSCLVKICNRVGWSRVFLILLGLNFAFHNISFAQVLLDTVRFNVLMDSSNYYMYRDLDSSYFYARQAVDLAEGANDNYYVADAYNAYGTYFYMMTVIDSSLHYFNKSAQAYQAIGNLEGYFDVVNGIGGVLFNAGRYNEALEELINGLTEAQKHEGLFEVKTTCYSLIGEIYQNLKNYELSNQYLYEGLALAREQGYTRQLAVTQGLLVYNLVEMGDYETAFEKADETKKLFREIEIEVGAAMMDYLIGKSHRNLEQYALAEEYLVSAESFQKDFGDPYYLMIVELELARLFVATGRDDQAELYLNRIVTTAAANQFRQELSEGYQELAKLYEGESNFKEALIYHRLHQEMADSLFNEKISAQMSDLETRYQTEQKEQQIALQSSQLTQQSQLRNGLIAGLLLVMAIGGLIYRSERLKTKKNHQIESLLREIHHRVKNNLQVISSLLNMQARGVDDSDMLETIKEGQSRVKAMSLIHQKLYQTEAVSEIDLQEYISELATQLRDLYLGAGTKVNTEVSANNVKLDLDTAIPLGLILNELISNAYKYAFNEASEGRINIDLQRVEGDQLKLQVSDNGKGLPSDLNLEKVKSLGLKLVNILTKQLKGNLSYESEGGSKFIINFKDLRMASPQ